MKYVDAHSHWIDDSPAQHLEKCLAQGIDFFLQGGVKPAEWLRQIELKKQFPENFGLCFGLHPYFVAENSVEECEAALDELTKLLPQALALGEAGLDFRPHIMKETEILQIEMFENQIELAKVFQKPMVLHLVQSHEKARQIFNLWDAPERGGFLHAFTGSFDTAKPFIDKGFLISVGLAATREKNRKLLDCISKIPLEYLLIESDKEDSTVIYSVAQSVALIRNISVFDVLEINTSNFKRLFRL